MNSDAAPGATPPGQVRKRRIWRVLSGVAAGLVLLAAGGVIGYAVHVTGPVTLDTQAVQAQVTGVLQNDYGVPNVTAMTCPHAMAVTTGARYTCTFTAGSAHASVVIVLQNTAGQYVVQGPTG